MKKISSNASNKLTFFLLIVLSISINIYFRLDPLFLNILKYASAEGVYTKANKILDKYISETYPTITAETKDKLSGPLFKQYLKENQAKIKKDISDEIKIQKRDFQDDKGFTYLLEEDPYRWMRRVENLLNTGHTGTRAIRGNEWDDLKSAPFGGEVEPIKLHYYAGAYFYKLLHAIAGRLSLMNCLSIFPLFLSVIMVLVIFGFCSAFGISRWAAFIASLAIGISKALLGRSSFGWFDTDLYNIIFPLFTVMILALALKAGNFKRGIYLLAAAFTIGVYSSFWSVWWMSFFMIILGLLLYKLEFIVYEETGNFRKRLKESMLFLILFVLFSYLFVFFISGFTAIKNSIIEPLAYVQLKSNLTIDGFWPNIGFSIQELNKAKAEDIINMCGGYVVYGGIAGLLLLFFLRKRLLVGGNRLLFFIIFSWLTSAIIMVNYGIRFLIFLVVPLGLAFAIVWDLAFYSLFVGYHKIYFIRAAGSMVKKILLAVLFFAMVIPVVNNASKINMMPAINNTWWKMLNQIEKNTPNNAIVNTYWDYADYVMTISMRATLYDGSWQYTPVAYWMPRVLLAPSEEEALGILRMLDSGSNSAFDELNGIIKDKKTTFELVNKLILTNKEEGADLISKYMVDNERKAKILKLIYSQPPPGYLLINNNLINMMPIVSRIANWDFERSGLWEKFKTLKGKNFIAYMRFKLGYSEKKAQEFYRTIKLMDKTDALGWVAQSRHNLYAWQSKTSMEDESVIMFDNGIVFDKKSLKTYFKDNFSREMIMPGRLIISTKEGITENINKEGNAAYTVFLIKDGNSKYTAFLFDSKFAQSLFFKLYFLQGRGLKHFRLVANEKKEDTNIYLYKIIWE